MATDVSIRLGVDGEKEFRSALNGINSQIKSLNNEMKSVVSGFTDMDDAETRVANQTDVLGRAIDATKQKIKTISAEYDRQKAKLNELGAALDEASSAEYSSTAERERAITKATNAYNRQANAVNKLSSDLNAANADLNRMEKEMRDLESGADKAGDAMDDLGSDAKGAGSSLREAFAGGAVAGAIQSLISGITGLVNQTKEYQKIMGTLEVSSQKAGYTADQTAASYQQLYGVIGDDQQSATALANLHALGVSQDQLTMFIDGAIGAWATYGDSIPIDGLAEAINETAQAGVVTGTFADVLNWAGTSEDEFNEKLAACGSESERANLILQELQNQGLMGAAAAWRENNAALVESNTAQNQMNQALASISETIMPVVATVTQGIATMLQTIQPAIQFLVTNLPIILPMVVAVGTAFLAWNVVSILQGVSVALTAVTTGIKAVTAAMAANPIGLVITIITSLIATLMTLWATNEGFREAVMAAWTAIQEKFTAAWAAISSAWGTATEFFSGIATGIQNAFNTATTTISQFFSDAWANIQGVWSSVVGFFQGVWSGISGAFSGAASTLGGFFSSARDAVQGAWSSVTGFFQNIWNGIRNAFSSVSSFFSNTFNAAKNAVQNAWTGISSFFSGKWNEIKNVFSDVWNAFSNIGRNIVEGIKSGVMNAWENLTGAIGEKVSSLISSVESKLGINSPSRAFRDRVGVMISLGIAAGIEKGFPEVLDTADKLNEKLLKEEEKLNKQLEEMELKAIQEEEAAKLAEHEKAIQEKYAELAEAEEDGKQKILDEIAKLEDDWNAEQLEKQKEAEKEKLEAQIKTLEDFKKEYQSALDEIEKSQESMAKKLKDYGDLFETVKTETGSFLELGDLEEDINAIQRYGDALEQLKARGVSDSLMDEIVSMSVDDATAYTEQLLSMTDDQYTEYMALWEKKQIEAQQIAKKFYSDEMDALQDEFVNKIPEELGGVKDEMRSIGVDGIQGMIDGMYSRSGALWSAAASIVSQAIAAMRMEADIHSPSRKVAKMVGVPMGEGVAVGLMQGIKESRRAIDAAIMQPISQVRPDDVYNAAAGAVTGITSMGGASTQTIVIPVNLNGKQIAEVIYDPLRQVGKQRGVAFG